MYLTMTTVSANQSAQFIIQTRHPTRCLCCHLQAVQSDYSQSLTTRVFRQAKLSNFEYSLLRQYSYFQYSHYWHYSVRSECSACFEGIKLNTEYSKVGEDLQWPRQLREENEGSFPSTVREIFCPAPLLPSPLLKVVLNVKDLHTSVAIYSWKNYFECNIRNIITVM